MSLNVGAHFQAVIIISVLPEGRSLVSIFSTTHGPPLSFSFAQVPFFHLFQAVPIHKYSSLMQDCPAGKGYIIQKLSIDA